MLIKKNLRKILEKLKEVKLLTLRVESDIIKDNKVEAEKNLKIISQLTKQELVNLNEILSNLKYDEPELIMLLLNLKQSLQETGEQIKIISNSLNSSSKKPEILLLLKNLEKLEKSQLKLEKSFLKLKVVDFEEILDETTIKKLPKKATSEKIKNFKKIFTFNSNLSPIEKVEKFEQLIDSMGGPAKAHKIYKKIFSLLNFSDKLVRRLFKTNKKSHLFKESENYISEEEIQDLPNTQEFKKYILPYPKKGIPTMKDLGFLLSLGMSWKLLLSVSAGPVLVKAVGPWAIVIILAVGSFLIWKKKVRFIDMGKKCINLLAFKSQGGSLKKLYGKYITPSTGEVILPA